MFLGDASVGSNGSIRYGSCSFSLASQVSTILNKFKVGNFLHDNKLSEGKFGGYTVGILSGAHRDTVLGWLRPYGGSVKIPQHASSRTNVDHIHAEGQLVALKSNKTVGYTGTVWDLSVEDDQSFVVHGVAVHNCPDYRYRWAWVNKQRGSSVVGPSSMNKSLNRAPVVTNPGSVPGLCKHLIKLREFLDGLLSDKIFGSTGRSDDSSMMRTLMRYADQRWTDTDPHQAVELEREVNRNRLRRNRGQLSPNAPLPPTGEREPSASAEHEDDEFELPTDNTNPQNPLNNATGYSPAPDLPDQEVKNNDEDDEDEEDGGEEQGPGKVESSAVVKDMNDLELLAEVEQLVNDLEKDRVVAAPPKLKSAKKGDLDSEEDVEGDKGEESEEVRLLKDIKDLLAGVLHGGKLTAATRGNDDGHEDDGAERGSLQRDYLQTAD